MLDVRRIVGAARDTVDQEVVDLPFIGVHEHGPAVAAAVVYGMGARDEDRRCGDDGARLRSFNYLEILTRAVGHDRH